MLTEAAKAQMAERAVSVDERAARAGRFGARTIGNLAMVRPGDKVWARTEGPDMRVDDRGNPLGGIILEIVDRVVVDDDGEHIPTRAFRTFDTLKPFHKAFHTLTEAQVEPEACEVSTPAQLVAAIRLLLREVVEGKHSLFTGRDDQYLHDAWTLTKTVMGKD